MAIEEKLCTADHVSTGGQWIAGVKSKPVIFFLSLGEPYNPIPFSGCASCRSGPKSLTHRLGRKSPRDSSRTPAVPL